MKYKKGDEVFIHTNSVGQRLPWHSYLLSNETIVVSKRYHKHDLFQSLKQWFLGNCLYTDINWFYSEASFLDRLKFWFIRENVYELEWHTKVGILYYLEKESRIDYIREQKRYIKISEVLG